MPEPHVDVRDATFQIEWDGAAFSGQGRLRLAELDVVAEVTTAGRTIHLSYQAVRGAELRSGALTMHARQGRIVTGGAPGLDLAWVTLQERACTLPEFTVGLRALGSRHGGDAALQGRFFAPLLSARRRLEEQREMTWRLAAFDAADLRERTVQVLRDLIAERTAATAAFRRSLEAQVLDEAEGLHQALDALGVAADSLRTVGDAERFEAWRMWATRARTVFAEADRCWLAVRPLLESVPVATRKGRGGASTRRRGGGGAALLLFACLIHGVRA